MGNLMQLLCIQKIQQCIVSFGRTGHETVDSQLIKRGLTTVPLNEQGANKGNLVENLANSTK